MSSKYLSKTDIEKLSQAIGEAENLSTGEIKIHIDSQTGENHAQKTLQIFQDLNMTQTQERNGVLFYINFEDKYLCILGDQGIHQKVTQSFWDQIHNDVTAAFSQKQYLQGLLDALAKTGTELKKHFPTKGTNLNELPNEITFS